MNVSRLFGMPSRRRRSRGQSLAEFALVLPVLLLIVMMGLDFGRVFLGWVNLNQAVRIGANFAALNPNANWSDTSTDSPRDRYNKLIQGDAAAINCAVPNPPPAPTYPSGTGIGSPVRVGITCQFALLTPLIDLVLPNPLPVTATAEWPIRSGSIGGGSVATAIPSATPSPVPTASPSPTPSPSPSPTASPTPTPGPTATPTPVPPPAPVAGFYGTPTGVDATGGGPGDAQIVGPFPLTVNFVNQSTGTVSSWFWEFGPAGATSTLANPSYTYSSPGLYTVKLTAANAGGSNTATRTQYVLVGCQVPNLQGVNGKQAAQNLWTSRGFQRNNLNFDPSSGNYVILRQSLQGGLVNPPGGCNATMTVYDRVSP